MNNYGFKLEQPILNNTIVILAGGIKNFDKTQLNEYFKIFRQAFKDHKGELISGCYADEINELILNFYTMPSKYNAYIYTPNRINFSQIAGKIVYKLPKIDFDLNLDIIFQYWFDILNSYSNPNGIKMIGINGGEIAALEYRMTIAFGVPLGIMENVQGAVLDLINDIRRKKIFDEKYVKKPYYLYKEVNNTGNDIYNFITMPFIKDPDIENIQLILIQNVASGTVVFSIEFIQKVISVDLISSFLKAVDLWGEEIKAGRTISVDFEERYIIGDFIIEDQLKVMIFLKKKPSEWLKEKISTYIKRVEIELGNILIQFANIFRSYSLTPEMSKIFKEVFGEEILKLVNK